MYGVAGSNFVPMIKIGAAVVLEAAEGCFESCANHSEQGALLQDIDFAISGMGAFFDHCFAAVARPATPGGAGESQHSMAK